MSVEKSLGKIHIQRKNIHGSAFQRGCFPACPVCGTEISKSQHGSPSAPTPIPPTAVPQQQLRLLSPPGLLKNAARVSCEIQDQNPPAHSFNIPGTIKKWNLAHIEKTQAKLSTSFAPGTSLPVTATGNSVRNYFKSWFYVPWPSKTRSILHSCSKTKAAQVSCSEEPFHASAVICQEKIKPPPVLQQSRGT